MPTQLLSPADSILVDHIGNEVYAAHYSERRLSRFVIGAEAVLLVASALLIHSLAHRPAVARYIRIDEMGRAQAIEYSDLNYTPREGEVRTYLTDWAGYRYTIERETVAKKYSLNYYYFLSQALASERMAEDNRNRFVSEVLTGRVEQSEVEVQSVTITGMSEETVAGARLAKGTALVALDRIYSARDSHEPRTERWLLSVTYYLNPGQVSELSRVFPQFETINPLGLTIVEFHESRISVQAARPEAAAPAVSGLPPQQTAVAGRSR